MEKAFIDFLNRLYDLTNDFSVMKKVAVVTMIICAILAVIFEAKRREFTYE